MSVNHIGTILKKMEHDGTKVKKWYHDDVLVYSAGNIVTYYVDGENNKFTEEVDCDASCLNPRPTLSGYEFVGWRKDNTADPNTESSVIMGSDPITLYAVFKKTVTHTFKSYNSSVPVKGIGYYNNGNTTSVSVAAPEGASYSGWNWRGWASANNTEARATASFGKDSTITTGINESNTYYALYYKDITLTTVVQGTETPYKNKGYYNAYGKDSYDLFTVSNPSIPDRDGTNAFEWWSNSSSSSTNSYSEIKDLLLKNNTTLYAVYTYKDATLKSGFAQYLSVNGNLATILTGIDGTKYSSITAIVQAITLNCGTWAMSTNAYTNVQTRNGNTKIDNITIRNTYKRDIVFGHEDEAIQQENPDCVCAYGKQASITLDLSNDTGLSLVLVYEGEVEEGDTYVLTVTAAGRTVIG